MIVYAVPATLSAIVFDIDNTLYRDDGYVEMQKTLLYRRFAQLNGMTEDEARSEIERVKLREAAKSGAETTSMGNAMKSLGVPIMENARWRSELFHPEEYLNRDSELGEALGALANRWKLAAVTNNSEIIGLRTLKTLGVENHFLAVIGMDTVGESKPSTALFRRAIDDVGSSAVTTLSIGDRYDVDIAPAVAVGMGGILIESMSDVYALPGFLEDQSNS